ncbi:MAG: FkbM family methyltransferase [Vicinamibacterales bacterium]
MATAREVILGLLPPSILGRLRAWRVRRMVASYAPRVVEHRYGDGPLRVHLGDPLGQGWYDHDWAQLPEISALRGTTLRSGARVFDIGAHQGVVAMMLAREVGLSGQVLAVEPNPHNAAVALKNRDLNGMKQIDVLEAAVSDQSGTVVFNHGLDGQLDDGTGVGGRMSVACTTLDELAQRHGMPAFVMIDVEGAECKVLKGGRDVLRSGADIAVEVHVGYGLEKLGGSVDELLSFFPADLFVVTARAEADASFRPLAPNDPLTRHRFFLLATATR